MPKVWNKRDPDCPKDAIYVGRPSLFGNPYIMGKDGNREDVIRKYKIWLDLWPYDVRRDELEKLRGKDLVCWCAPLPCHADILLEMANGSSRNESTPAK